MADERSITQRLFEALVERGLVTAEQLTHAQELHAQTRQPLGEVLVARGLITPGDVRQVLEDDLGVPHLDLASYAPEPTALRLVPAAVARAQRILPLFEIEGMLTVAVANPLDVFGLDELSAQLAYELEPVLSDPSAITEAIDGNYGPATAEAAEAAEAKEPEGAAPAEPAAASAEPQPAGAGAGGPEAPAAEKPETATTAAPAAPAEPAAPAAPAAGPIDLDVLAIADATTIVTLITQILEDASDAGASHVHVDPGPEEFVLSYRVGAERRRIGSAAIGFESALTRSVRTMARVAEASGAPAAGRMRLLLRDSEVTVGVSLLPTTYGERLVMSMPAPSDGPARLDETGMAAEDRATLEGALALGKGLALVGGPVRSGRSTLYSLLLAAQVGSGRSVLSIEDRVTRELDGAYQVELSPVSGLSATSALSVAVRQDADVIAVDELRGPEDFHLLIEAAADGRLGIATAIGSDCCDTIGRWIAAGVEPKSLASHLSVVVCTRVVSRNCPRCRKPYTSDLAKDLEGQGQVVSLKGTGCAGCDDSGVAGKTGIFELLVIDDALRHAIAVGSSTGDLRAVSSRGGTRTLLENGYLQVAAGELTLEELNRAVPFARV